MGRCRAEQTATSPEIPMVVNEHNIAVVRELLREGGQPVRTCSCVSVRHGDRRMWTFAVRKVQPPPEGHISIRGELDVYSVADSNGFLFVVAATGARSRLG